MLVGASAHGLCAQTLPFDPAPPGAIESGTAAFVVLGPEALGLGTAPTDLKQLPDGRILAAARGELALGDGVRWQVFRQAPADRRNDTVSVAVDATGAIYAGVQGGIGRIDFGTDGQWRLTTVAQLPETAAAVLRPVLTQVAMSKSGWFWHSGSGAVISWAPGESAKIVGNTNTIERVFAFETDVFISNRTDGALLRVRDGAASYLIDPAQTTANLTVTCGTPYDSAHLLVGTNAEGLKLFDGTRFTAFPIPGLATELRINDLCSTYGGFFAAAVDNHGIILFNTQGRIVQTIDRTLDHRLGRVQRLFYTAGTLWALLNDGVARIRFPSRLSSFEPLVSTGLAYAQPFRHDGRLWLLADGRAQRGVYNPEGRLLHFVEDSPPGTFVHTLSGQLGPLLATNERGAFRRRDGRWEPILPIPNLRIDIPSTDGKRWLYVARDELGWIERMGDTYQARRLPQPGLGDVYAMAADDSGKVWLELGSGRVGRVDIGGEDPGLEIFAARDGVADGWVNIFVLDGIAYFNIANRLFRFDETTRRFTEDSALVARYPAMEGIVGRPVRDSRGRLWVTSNGTVHVLADTPRGPVPAESIPNGLQPYLFTVEKGGVVWMHETRRLARYDPAMPQPEEAPLRATLSLVHFPASNQHVFAPGAELPPIPFRDNSIVVHYLAPGTPFGQAVTFEVRLDGAGTEWVSTGGTGSAAFNRLKEGRYLLHVRPRTDTSVGHETTLAFVVRPPWFRTPWAYGLYGLTAIAAMLGIAWWSSYLERREKARLEHLVAARTRELHETNRRLNEQVHATLDKAAALVASEERYRKLNEGLEQRVADRTTELTASNRELESFSYSVSHDLRAPLRNISGFADLLRKRLAAHADPESLRFMGIISTEAVRLGQLIDALLVFSRLGRSDLKLRTVDLAALFAEARREFSSDLARRAVEFRINPLPAVEADPTLLRQVLVNLLGNALKFSRDRQPAVIEVGVASISPANPGEVAIYLRDNGVGFDPKYTDKLFGVFQRLHHARDFEGTGIGLANVRRIITRHGGRVWAESTPGAGATFYFTLPSTPRPGRS